MAVGKSKVKINLNRLNLNIGSFKIIENSDLLRITENDVAEYMKSLEIQITVQVGTGSKDFEVFYNGCLQKNIKINSDYRSGTIEKEILYLNKKG